MSDKAQANSTNTQDQRSTSDASAEEAVVPVADQSAAESFEHLDEFARQAEEAPMGLIAEVWDFLKHEKKWWLTPIIVVLLLLGVLIFSSSSSALAPFIYPLF